MNPTTNEELFKLHQELCDRGLKLMMKKNADYANSHDALRNFRMAKLINVDDAKGILLRMQDKMARIVSFIEKGHLEVTSEGWDDSIVDLINYAVILHACLREKCAMPNPVGYGPDKSGYATSKLHMTTGPVDWRQAETENAKAARGL